MFIENKKNFSNVIDSSSIALSQQLGSATSKCLFGDYMHDSLGRTDLTIFFHSFNVCKVSCYHPYFQPNSLPLGVLQLSIAYSINLYTHFHTLTSFLSVTENYIKTRRKHIKKGECKRLKALYRNSTKHNTSKE